MCRLYNRFSGNFRNDDVIHDKHRRPRHRQSLTTYFGQLSQVITANSTSSIKRKTEITNMWVSRRSSADLFEKLGLLSDRQPSSNPNVGQVSEKLVNSPILYLPRIIKMR